MKQKSQTTSILFKQKQKRKLGRHSKKKTQNKGSKNYSKVYRGQGRN